MIWCYIDLFGPEHLSKIILVDQLPLVTSDPHWTQQELEDSGASLLLNKCLTSLQLYGAGKQNK